MFDMRKIEAGPEIADFIEDHEVEQLTGWEELTEIQEESLHPVVKEEEELQQEDDPNHDGGVQEKDAGLGRGRRTKFPRTVFSYNV